MKVTAIVFALVLLAGCDRKPVPAPVQPAGESKSGIELSVDTEKGAIGFKKDEGGGDRSVDIDIKTN